MRKTNKIFLQVGKVALKKKEKRSRVKAGKRRDYIKSHTSKQRDCKLYANMYTSKIDETRTSQQKLPFEDFMEEFNIPN